MYEAKQGSDRFRMLSLANATSEETCDSSPSSFLHVALRLAKNGSQLQIL